MGSAREMKPHKDELMLGLVSPRLSSVTQDFAPGTQKRCHQTTVNQQDDPDDDGLVDELANPAEKKRRLTIDQVKFLEMSFNMDLKLEPERKALIAKKLGLRPRQVAIWFQNRRARWKNKQLEQDYEALKAKYEAIVKENDGMGKKNEAMMEENKKLQEEVAHLTASLQSTENHGISDVMDTGRAKVKESPGSDSDSESRLKQEQLSGNSELTSPTKSSDDQSETQDSGYSYPTSEEAVVVAIVDPPIAELNSIIACTAVKLEAENQPLLPSDEMFGNFNPVLLQQFVNGFYVEDLFLSWEDQSYGFTWGG